MILRNGKVIGEDRIIIIINNNTSGIIHKIKFDYKKYISNYNKIKFDYKKYISN